MRTIFFGSSSFSVPILKSISRNTVCVVTRKSKPKGRGYTLDDNEVKRAAEEIGLPVIEIDSFRDESVKLLPDHRPDIFVVASFGLIIPKWVLDMPPQGPINIHPSLLPLYRGPSPIQWAILKGDETTGITFIWMNQKMDEGDIVYQERIEIGKDEDYISLSERLSIRSAEVLPEFLGRFNGTMERSPQNHEKATYTPIITKDMGVIDWSKTASEIHRQVRALIAWPTAYTTFEGKLVKIFRSVIDKDREDTGPGRIWAVNKEGIYVGTGSGSLVIRELQMENKKRMKAYDFAQGIRGLIGKSFS
ncbi:MAG TPA: methionyl-tRNA formyltransferase [Syntrophorhabdaceae bacterium]|nr:methionyl-tRNA formyltransferase [Syntrophorhabdaceae bacterium]